MEVVSGGSCALVRGGGCVRVDRNEAAVNLIVARSPIGSSRPGVVYHRVVGARTLPVEAWLQIKPYRLLDLSSLVRQDDINFVRFGPLVVVGGGGGGGAQGGGGGVVRDAANW